MNRRKKCELCAKDIDNVRHHYCDSCRKIAKRINRSKRIKDKKACRKSLSKYIQKEKGYYCKYSGVALDLGDDDDQSQSPCYLTFEHVVPGDDGTVVLAAALINDMKSDMNEREFKGMVVQLANRFKTGKKINSTFFRLKHWNRKNI